MGKKDSESTQTGKTEDQYRQDWVDYSCRSGAYHLYGDSGTSIARTHVS